MAGTGHKPAQNPAYAAGLHFLLQHYYIQLLLRIELSRSKKKRKVILIQTVLHEVARDGKTYQDWGYSRINNRNTGQNPIIKPK